MNIDAEATRYLKKTVNNINDDTFFAFTYSAKDSKTVYTVAHATNETLAQFISALVHNFILKTNTPDKAIREFFHDLIDTIVDISIKERSNDHKAADNGPH